MPQSSWLFIKDGQSIWIERPYGCSIIIAGPGDAHEQHDFPDEAALDAYQVSIAEQLTEAGWFLWGFDRERRTGLDRRTAGRRPSDRRRSAASASPR
jgi:hypothetical protein